MIVEFSGDIWFWKGPAPWFFITVPENQSQEIREIVSMVTYGWGMIPVNATIGNTTWYTALWPKDGCYILPIKSHVRMAEKLAEGDTISARIEVIRSNLASG